MQPAKHRLAYYEFGALFFLQWMALAAWTVPLSLVLKTHGLEIIQPYAFATSALAAFVTPLFFGAVADRHVAPTRVLRWLALASGISLVLCCLAIQSHCNPWLVLALIQLYSLCASPTTSVSSALVMATVADPRSEFGPIRAMGTIGWMAGCLLVSALNADASTLAAAAAATIWFSLVIFTLFLPVVTPNTTAERLTWHERLGLDALTLLRKPDHRVVFLTTSLLCIPLAAFYPHTPAQLAATGFKHPAAWMSLGQVTEIAAMFSLGWLFLRWRLKWIIAAGLGFAVLRFLCCALNTRGWLLVGILLHGCSYAYVYATAQIYVNERVDPGWRVRAQALLSLLNSGVGNLAGYLGAGWWFAACSNNDTTRWPLFWMGIAAASAAVTIYFLAAYRGKGVAPQSNYGTRIR